MKKYFIAQLSLLFCFPVFCQIQFEKGYLINNDGDRIECLIKNLDWEGGLSGFSYRLDENSPIQQATIDNVQEFSVDGWSKYVRKTVDIDVSKVPNLKDVSIKRSPNFKKETLFLNVVVDGYAKLFTYHRDNTRWFFFSIDDGEVAQLVHKQFYSDTNDGIKLGTNNYYKQQLSNSFSCDDITIKRITTVGYNTKDLTKLFVNYNECLQEEFNVVGAAKKKERDLININLRAGYTNAFVSLTNIRPGVVPVTFKERRLSFGVEAEFILPFKKGKWSIILEPTFFTAFEGEKQTSSGRSTIQLNTIEVPIGLRHYFFLNDDLALFINSTATIEIPSERNLNHRPLVSGGGIVSPALPNTPSTNWSAGGGMKFYSKYYIEGRYQIYKDLLDGAGRWFYDHKSISVILRYNLF